MSVELLATNNTDPMVLEEFPLAISRGAENAVKTDSATPGSYHCLVSMADGRLVVWNLGSAGGTMLNGSQVTQATIKPGDTLEIGGTKFQVNYKPPMRRYLCGVRSWNP
jgi:pSer/pThr/pTyr-binding forkhead associated (FHA) protein